MGLTVGDRSDAAKMVHPRSTAGTAEKMKCSPSGRKDGLRCDFSPRVESSWVATVMAPPFSEMRESGLLGEGENRMSPFFPQAPPRLHCTSHSLTGVPPAAGTFFRHAPSPLVKYPIQRPSGDQNGWSAFSDSG